MTTDLLAALAASWMVGTAMVGALLAVVAWLLHRVLRDLIPARVVWGGALFGALLTGLALPFDARAPRSIAVIGAVPTGTLAPRETPPSAWLRVRSATREVMGEIGRRFTLATSAAAHSVMHAPRAVQVGTLLLWPLTATVMLVVVATGYRRRVRAAARGEPMRLHGTTVTVTERIGPAVLGVRTPRIVIPRWLLERADHEQQLVVRHERAHIDANDPLLLLAACGAVVCMPWNPAMWYMLSRLRLAIELDCDRRVLSQGTARRSYGELLVNLSARAHHVAELSPFPAFSYRPSHLERRLRHMTDRPTTHRGSRLTAGILLATAGFMAACGSELPTSAEVATMDVAAAERVLLKASPGASVQQYVVDGKTVSAAEATAIPAARIAAIDVRRANGKGSIVSIRTVTASDSTARPLSIATALRGTINGDSIRADTAVVRVVALSKDGTGDSLRTFELRGNVRATPLTSGTDLLIFIDGAKAAQKDMDAMDPSRIASVEIIKGAAAEQLYGASARKGVIKITTKKP